MPGFGRGSQRGIRYIAEVTPGTTPATPNMKIFRTTNDTLNLGKQTFQSQELRSDRQIVDLRHGTQQAAGDLGFELSYGSVDDFLTSAFMNPTWVAMYNLPTVANVTIAAAGKTFSRAAGDWTAAGVTIGDYIVTTGFTNGGNNGTFKVTNVSALVITCAAAVGLVNEGPVSTGNFTTTHMKLVTGTTLTTFSIEKAHLDISQFLCFKGMSADKMKLNIAPNKMVDGAFSFVGMSVVGPAGVTYATGGITPAPTGTPFDGFTGSILEAGTPIAYALGLDLSLDNGMTAAFALMANTAQAIIDKRSNITGTLKAYFQDATMLSKWIAETSSSIAFTLTDLAGNQYKITIPKVKYSGGSIPVAGEGVITLSMPFQALYDSVTGTNVIWERIPF